MIGLSWFMDRTATLSAVDYPQDPSGGQVASPAPLTVDVPCCVQQDGPPRRSGKESSQQRSTEDLAIFFDPANADAPAAALAALKALKVKDVITLDDGRQVVLDGPAFDRSGRGEVLEAAGRYTS